MIEKREITLFHRVPEHVSRLIVAHPVPRGGPFRRRREIVDAERGRFRFKQPVIHRSPPLEETTPHEKCARPDSVARESRRTSQVSANTVSTLWQSKASPTRRGPFQDLRT